MSTRIKTLAFLTALGALGVVSTASANPLDYTLSTAAHPYGDHFVHSARGPGSKRGALSIAAKTWVTDDSAIPMLQLDYLRSINRRWDFEVRGTTVLFVNMIDIGARYRIVEGRNFSLAARVDATAIVVPRVPETDEVAVGFGATPGIVASVGSDDLQLSLGLDAPMYFGSAALSVSNGAEATTGFVPTLKPNVTVEADFGSFGAYLRGEVWMVRDTNTDDIEIAPMATLGVTF
jgi:hypothetical protein